MALSMRLFCGAKRVMFKDAFLIAPDTAKTTTDTVLDLVRAFVLRDHDRFDKAAIARAPGLFVERRRGTVCAAADEPLVGLDYVSLVRILVENESYLVQVGTSVSDTMHACRSYCARAIVDARSNSITFESAYFEPDGSVCADPDIIVTSIDAARAMPSTIAEADLVSALPDDDDAGAAADYAPLPCKSPTDAGHHDNLLAVMHVIKAQLAKIQSDERIRAAHTAKRARLLYAHHLARRDGRIRELEQQVEALQDQQLRAGDESLKRKLEAIFMAD